MRSVRAKELTIEYILSFLSHSLMDMNIINLKGGGRLQPP